MGKIEDAINELRLLLDTFYNDLESWLELADMYSTCCQYVFLSFGLIVKPLLMMLQIYLSPPNTLTCSPTRSDQYLHLPPIR